MGTLPPVRALLLLSIRLLTFPKHITVSFLHIPVDHSYLLSLFSLSIFKHLPLHKPTLHTYKMKFSLALIAYVATSGYFAAAYQYGNGYESDIYAREAYPEADYDNYYDLVEREAEPEAYDDEFDLSARDYDDELLARDYDDEGFGSIQARDTTKALDDLSNFAKAIDKLMAENKDGKEKSKRLQDLEKRTKENLKCINKAIQDFTKTAPKNNKSKRDVDEEYFDLYARADAKAQNKLSDTASSINSVVKENKDLAKDSKDKSERLQKLEKRAQSFNKAIDDCQSKFKSSGGATAGASDKKGQSKDTKSATKDAGKKQRRFVAEDYFSYF